MKKIILTLAAIFTMGIAAAQTDPKDPKQVLQPPQTPSTPLPPPKTDIKQKVVKDEVIQRDGVTNEPKMQGEVQPRKDELKTQGHVKSTPKPSTVNDTVKSVKQSKRARRN
jgi:hypothetical protein